MYIASIADIAVVMTITLIGDQVGISTETSFNSIEKVIFLANKHSFSQSLNHFQTINH